MSHLNVSLKLAGWGVGGSEGPMGGGGVRRGGGVSVCVCGGGGGGNGGIPNQYPQTATFKSGKENRWRIEPRSFCLPA